MTYELAKKLKEAGFIQRKWKYSEHYIPDKNSLGEQMIILYENYEGSGDDLVYIPPLSELIEACGSGKGNQSLTEEEEGKWLAEKYHEVEKAPEQSYGLTPTEAVSNLWLELNKK